MDINYFKFGEGTKIIAIIPGVSLGNIISLRNSIEAEYDIFKKDYTLYVFDRYHSLKRGYTIDDMAYDMINAFDELCLKDINVISTSQGGQIAQVVAIKRPDLIKKLVLFSTTPIITDEKYDLSMVISFICNYVLIKIFWKISEIFLIIWNLIVFDGFKYSIYCNINFHYKFKYSFYKTLSFEHDSITQYSLS